MHYTITVKNDQEKSTKQKPEVLDALPGKCPAE